MKPFIFILSIHMTLVAQLDMIGGYRPRIITRGKMWSAFRNNGLDGGGDRNNSSSHSQESLSYPGNIARSFTDFVEYFADVEAYLNGDPHIIDPPRVTISQNSKGQGSGGRMGWKMGRGLAFFIAWGEGKKSVLYGG